MNYYLKKLFFKSLDSPLFTHNQLYKYLYLKKVARRIKKLDSNPPFAIIENTNFCNLSCIFCANSEMRRKRGFMTAELFKSIIDQCVFYKISNILIQGFGEPLLDQDYVKRIAYAKQKGIKKVNCVSNAVLLTSGISEGLIRAGLDYIGISIDAATPEVYGKIHRWPDKSDSQEKFSAVVENIDNLFKLKNKFNSTTPFVEVRFKDFDLNNKDLKEFIKKYKGRANEINIYMNITNWPGSSIENNLPRVKLLKFPCYNLWTTLYITYEGKVILCCQDYEGRMELGDLNREDIMQIWRGENLKRARELHINREFDKNIVCKDCVINTHLVSPWWMV